MTAGQLSALQMLASIFMVLGMLSMITIVLPGLTVMWIVALVYIIATGFTVTSTIFFVIITLLTIFGMVIDNIMMGASASKTGATWWGVGLALVAGVVGSLVWPPFGGLAAAKVIMFVVEILRLRDWKRAAKSTGSILVGCGLSALVRFGVSILILVLWFVWLAVA